jgi:drug/metabolite transporter (DMT)-like permease
VIGPLFSSQREVLNWAGGFIASSLVAILAYLCWALVNKRIPTENENIIFALVGGVMTQVTHIVSFFFGSSSTTKKQAETIDTLSRVATTGGPSIVTQPGDTVRTESQTHTETRVE